MSRRVQGGQRCQHHRVTAAAAALGVVARAGAALLSRAQSVSRSSSRDAPRRRAPGVVIRKKRSMQTAFSQSVKPS